MGKLICLEGIDGSGKTTVIKKLQEKLKAEGFDSFCFKFPSETTEGKKLKAMLLKGGCYNPYYIHLLFETDKLSCQDNLTLLLKQNDFLFLDRYRLSNIVYGVAKGFDKDWCETIGRYFLVPDHRILLTCSMEIVKERLLARPFRDNNEKNIELLEKVNALYETFGEEGGYTLVNNENNLENTVDRIYKIITWGNK